MRNAGPTKAKQSPGSAGPVAGLLIVLFALLLGGYYALSEQLERRESVPESSTTTEYIRVTERATSTATTTVAD